jgi:hypothetical protein
MLLINNLIKLYLWFSYMKKVFGIEFSNVHV